MTKNRLGPITAYQSIVNGKSENLFINLFMWTGDVLYESINQSNIKVDWFYNSSDYEGVFTVHLKLFCFGLRAEVAPINYVLGLLIL